MSRKKRKLETATSSFATSNDVEKQEVHVNSAVLRRIIEEIRVEETTGVPHRYDRFHSRHNRS